MLFLRKNTLKCICIYAFYPANRPDVLPENGASA
jgi:hypothetical protein